MLLAQPSPAPEHVAVAESPAGHDAAEILQRDAAAEDVRHVHVDRL